MTTATGWSKAATRAPAVARADRDAGRDDEPDHGQAEDQDVARRRRRPAPTRCSPGRCHSDDSVGTRGRWHERAEPQAGRQPAEVRGVVDRAARREPEDDVDDHDG